ncbi:MAG: hypothetical protein K8R87_12985 [Verrucomicrobia bacterium]|nr:hypothetical protein [Verrucomicrobiota bacterium]
MKFILASLSIQVLLCFEFSTLGAAPNFWDEIPLSPSTTMPGQIQDDYWNGEFQRVNREVLQAKETKLFFLGDSITWNWSLGDKLGHDIWRENYAQYQPVNMGNSGDITPVMLYRVTHGNLNFTAGRQPKVAVLLCGINNLGVTQSDGGKEKWDLGAKCPPADIAHGKRAIAQVIRRRLPETRVIMLAILPVADKVKWAKCQQANASNAADACNPNEVAYVDLQEKFLLPDGSINKRLYTDGTHLSTEGYRVWAQGIEPIVKKFMDAPPLDPVKIMLIGDSITEGLDSSSSYRRYLDGMLRISGHQIDLIGSRQKHHDDKTDPDSYQYDVDHEGHWGKDSAWMAENLPRRLTGNMPDVAVIQLGSEDVVSSKAAAEPLTDGIVKNINQVIELLRSKNENIKIVLSKVIPSKEREEVINLLNAKISQYVQAHSTPRQRVVLADPNAGFDVSQDLADDGMLPNPSGARKIAEAFAIAINRLIDDATRH